MCALYCDRATQKCKKAKIFRHFCGGYRLSPEKERREKRIEVFECMLHELNQMSFDTISQGARINPS